MLPPLKDDEVEKEPASLTRFGAVMLKHLESENLVWFTVDPVLAFTDNSLPVLSSSTVTAFKTPKCLKATTSEEHENAIIIPPVCPPISLRKFSGIIVIYT